MKSSTKTDKIVFALPVFIWCMLVPLTVKTHVFANPMKEYAWFLQEDPTVDFFLYWKAVLIVLAAVVMCVVFVKSVCTERKRKKGDYFGEYKIFFLLAGYAVLTVLSALFSAYRSFCVKGMPGQFETLQVLLAYAFACFFICWLVREKNGIQTVVYALLTGALAVGLICVLQFFRLDIYRLIYSGSGYSFTFQPGQVYGPFYNINYVGSYVVLLLPLFLLLALKGRQRWLRLLCVVAALFLGIAIYGSRSMAGWIGLCGAATFAMWFLLLKRIPAKKGRVLYVAGSMAALILVCVATVPRVQVWLENSDTQKTNLEHIYTREDCVEIDYRGHKLFIDMSANGDALAFRLLDENGIEVESEYTETNTHYYYTISDSRFPNFKLVPTLYSEEPVQYAFQLTLDEEDWIFSKDAGEDGTYYWLNANWAWTKLTEENDSPDGALFGNISALASGRGFIWNKTLPLLKQTVLFGTGPDTFALVFPNDDYVDLYNNGYHRMFHTKPHNMYLQTAVQTGCLSLICWLIFYAWYFWDSLRIYQRVQLDDFESVCGFAIMIGTLAYMIVGLANDSTVTVAPIYWCILGAGIGINQLLKRQLQMKN